MHQPDNGDLGARRAPDKLRVFVALRKSFYFVGRAGGAYNGVVAWLNVRQMRARRTN